MIKRSILLFALMLPGCGDDKSGDSDTETGTGTGTDTDAATGTTTDAGTGTETGTDTDPGTGAPTGSGGDQPVQLDPSGCLSQCVEDLDPSTAPVEFNCEVCDYDPVQHACAAIVACEQVMGGWAIPAGQEACFAARIDAGNETPSEIDNMSQACVDGGSNLEIELLRGGEPPAGTFVAVTCDWSVNVARDCPDLPAP